MGRGVVTGILAGLLCSAVGLAVISVILPPAGPPAPQVSAEAPGGSGGGALNASDAVPPAPGADKAPVAAQDAGYPPVTASGTGPGTAPEAAPEPAPGEGPGLAQSGAAPQPIAGLAPPMATSPTPETAPAMPASAAPAADQRTGQMAAPVLAPAEAATDAAPEAVAPDLAQGVAAASPAPVAEPAPGLDTATTDTHPTGAAPGQPPAPPAAMTAPDVAGTPAPQPAVQAAPTGPVVAAAAPAPAMPGSDGAETPTGTAPPALPVPDPAPAGAPAAGIAAPPPVLSITTAPSDQPIILVPPGAEAPAPAPDAGTGTGGDSALRPVPPIPPAANVVILTPGAQAQGGIVRAVPGVITNRLPQIGAPAATEAAAAAPAEPERPAFSRNAVDYSNPEGKPQLSIVLIDDGAPSLDRVALAATALPVTFAVDPTKPNAAQAARTYRDAGHEVLVLATAIPRLATPSDLAVTFADYFRTVGEAVGVMDLETGGFAANRQMAQRVTTILADDGYGMVTYAKGLNAASQMATTLGVPSAEVFNSLLLKNASDAALQHQLDRAAFRAAQEGRAVIVGQAGMNTLSMLDDWMHAPKAQTVTLAPITATFKK